MIHLTNAVRRADTPSLDRVKEIVRVTYIHNSENWKFSLHEHEDFCELIYIEAGEGQYTIDNREYHVCEGNIVLINQNVGHVQRSNPDHPLTIWNISVRLSATEELEENMILPEGIQPVLCAGKWKEACEACCKELYQEIKEQEEYSDVLALGLMERYLLLVQRALHENGMGEEAKIVNIAEEVQRYIDKNYAEKISLDDLAKRFHCSKYHLSHEMKKYYNISPINYLIARRIGKAQNLLCTTDIPIHQIAEMVGYENANYFNALFHRRLGISPQQFRDSYENIQ